uniref:Ferritin n=1 Tax=Rhabditophanes sp. KR3021 TaxID=114890 RepID=A0AC35UA96_9BILA
MSRKLKLSSRQAFSNACEKGINIQIQNELMASYTYLALANFFARDVVALHGISRFFYAQSEEESKHGRKLMKYLLNRGGCVVLYDIKASTISDSLTLLDALKHAYELEKTNNAALLELHEVASKSNDSDLTSFLEEHYLKEQIDEINLFAKLYNRLLTFGDGIGVYFVEKEMIKLCPKEKNSS